MKLVINSSAIIALSKVGLLELLSNYNIIVPEAVYKEVTTPEKPESSAIAKILRNHISRPKNRDLVNKLSENLGLGESETIALALEVKGIAVLDDQLARKIARKVGVKVKGLLWILIDKKRKGKLSSIKPILDRLIEKKFRISKRLYQKVLELVGER